ncbi:MAG: 50S ribosomal protein L21 [Candidatus Cloacimonas sp. SDB]|nr:MAG: 50S ribosomal protein L21 [Candidatus Cloacimonas sp. SDB]
MYAIIDIKGIQHKVEIDKIVKVPFMKDTEIGSEIEIDQVLLLNDDKKIKIGDPVVKNVKVIAEVLSHNKEKKIIVFKKKRRKGYEKKQGHRQNFTQLKIKEIRN